MTLADYDTNIKPRLQFIESGAEMAARNARALPARPSWTTKAEDELDEAERVLETALAKIREAKVAFASKPLEVA